MEETADNEHKNQTVAEPIARTKSKTSVADVPVKVAADDKRTGPVTPDARAHVADGLSRNVEATIATVPNTATLNNLTAAPNPKTTKYRTTCITPTTRISMLTYHAEAYIIGNAREDVFNYQGDAHVSITAPTATHEVKLLDNIGIGFQVYAYVSNTYPAAKMTAFSLTTSASGPANSKQSSIIPTCSFMKITMNFTSPTSPNRG